MARKRSVIGTVRALAKRGAIVISEHALTESMVDDGLFPDDVCHVLANASQCVAQDDVGVKFKVRGPIVNGAELIAVVNVRADHLFVVTCHLPP
jgi:hypothetical protein